MSDGINLAWVRYVEALEHQARLVQQMVTLIAAHMPASTSGYRRQRRRRGYAGWPRRGVKRMHAVRVEVRG